MKVTFSSTALAALCNSELHLAERWGAEAGRAIGRRLLDLAAIDFDHLEDLPDVDVSSDGAREVMISFVPIVIEAEIIVGKSAGRPPADGDCIVITRLAVLGR